MTEEQHLWASALEMQRQHGDWASARVAWQIDALLIAGDLDGVRRWRAIGACLAALDRPDGEAVQ